jgi:2-dehydropantoate 2-reductase
MQILIIGAGVVGTVYGAHLGAAGHAVSVLAHGERTESIANGGLVALNMTTGAYTRSPARVIGVARDGTFDLVVVALQRDHLHAAATPLAALADDPLVLFLGNNPAGREALPVALDARVSIGFPGVGGTMVDEEAQYVKISKQPTALEETEEPVLGEVSAALRSQGLGVQRVSDMGGWLAFHSVFVSCVAAALYDCGTDPLRLAANRSELKLMCQAITEGFRALESEGLRGLPRNLALLHRRYLTQVAVLYWAHAMRTPMGELAFAAHSRHAESEMRVLAKDVLLRLGRSPSTESVTRLLGRTSMNTT